MMTDQGVAGLVMGLLLLLIILLALIVAFYYRRRYKQLKNQSETCVMYNVNRSGNALIVL